LRQASRAHDDFKNALKARLADELRALEAKHTQHRGKNFLLVAGLSKVFEFLWRESANAG
jgi:hypothetical protein